MKEMKQEGCRDLAAVDHVEEMSLESPRKRQDVQDVMGETAGNATRGRGEDAWGLEPEGETETPETRVVADGVEGIYVDLKGEVKNHRNPSDVPGEEGEEIKSPKRETTRVESEETQDHVRETKSKD